MKLWDLSDGKPVTTITQHKDKVGRQPVTGVHLESKIVMYLYISLETGKILVLFQLNKTETSYLVKFTTIFVFTGYELFFAILIQRGLHVLKFLFIFRFSLFFD